MNEDRLLKDLGEYLKFKGWDVSVIGFSGVSKGNLEHNYSLIVDFTGRKMDALVNSEEGK